MLVAYGPDGQPITADNKSLSRLQELSRDRALQCPNCRGHVHVRGGPDKRMQLHFAHKKGECAWSTEGESVRHMRGKWLLSQWLQQQLPTATVSLEERLPEPNRIADIFVKHHDGRSWAVEFQCAPLDIDEWKHRHSAYQRAGIRDTWIIGYNRYTKQEAFLEAILTYAHEILFVDPLVEPVATWLRWPIPRKQALQWQEQTHTQPAFQIGDWVGRTGHGITLHSMLAELSLSSQAQFLHPLRTQQEQRIHLHSVMSLATQVSTEHLSTYLQHTIYQQELHHFLLPLSKAFIQDSQLFWRYNYGRGRPEHPLSATDSARVQKASAWLHTLIQRGIDKERLLMLSKEIPFIGPYASFASYTEQVLALL